MTMAPRVRKLALTAHVVTSISWLGAVLVFLALTVVGLISPDPLTVRGAYVVMEPVAWSVLVPLAFTSLLTGLVVSLGSTWGLFRHYWVVFKLLINIYSGVFLLIFMESFREITAMAADPRSDLEMVRETGTGFVRFHSLLALVMLLAATVLAIYKPRGITRYGWRKQRSRRRYA